MLCWSDLADGLLWWPLQLGLLNIGDPRMASSGGCAAQ